MNESAGLDPDRLDYYARVSAAEKLLDDSASKQHIESQIGAYDDDIVYSDERISQIIEAFKAAGEIYPTAMKNIKEKNVLHDKILVVLKKVDDLPTETESALIEWEFTHTFGEGVGTLDFANSLFVSTRPVGLEKENFNFRKPTNSDSSLPL